MSPKIYIIAGEPSGDFLGRGLIQALYQKQEDISIFGVGGIEMEKESFTSLFPLTDLSVMGLFEIIPRLPLLIKRYHHIIDDIVAKKPDVLVTIDSPDFCLRIAKVIKKRLDLPIIHYGAPSVWAWRPRRAAHMARFLDHVLTLFPFEPPYFQEEGLSSTFIGHPLTDSCGYGGDIKCLRVQYNIPDFVELIAVLPGSRVSEVKRHWPIFLDTMRQLHQKKPSVHFMIPTFEHLKKFLMCTENDRAFIHFCGQDDKIALFNKDASCALAVSGTVCLELAQWNVPMVIAYRTNLLTYYCVKPFITIDWVCLINIILKKSLIPEHIQKKCTSQQLGTSLQKILETPFVQKQCLSEAYQALKNPFNRLPSEHAASIILESIR